MKTVLITGAYRGLGYEVARQLSERGWKVILTARRKDQGSAAAAKLKNASFLELDITADASVARAVKEVPKLDVLINNAAIIADGDQDILTIRPELVTRTIATNALGALRVSQALVPRLLKSPAGRIVNVSSGAGQLSDMGTWSPAYALSKTTLNGITCVRPPLRKRALRQFSLPRVVPHRDGWSNCTALGRGGRGRNRLAGG